MLSRRLVGCRAGAGQTKNPRPHAIVDEGQTASSRYHHDSSPAQAGDLHQFHTRRVKLSHANGCGPWRTTAPNRRLVARLGGVIWGRAAMTLAACASLSVRSASAPDLSSVSALDGLFARRRRFATIRHRRHVRRGYAEGSMAAPHTSRRQPGQRSATYPSAMRLQSGGSIRHDALLRVTQEARGSKECYLSTSTVGRFSRENKRHTVLDRKSRHSTKRASATR